MQLTNPFPTQIASLERLVRSKRAGYDVFLVLEATIGFNKRDEEEDGTSEHSSESPGEPVQYEPNGKIRLTSQDQKFLRALKISVEEDHKSS